MPPYTIVGGVPAGPIRKRFDDDTIRRLQDVYKRQDAYRAYDVAQLRKRVGMVFQKPNPFPMSIYDNIA